MIDKQKTLDVLKEWFDAGMIMYENLPALADEISSSQWSTVENPLPEDNEIVWGVSGDRAWVFKWSKEHNHFLEYTDKRGGRWEFTTLSNNVFLWQPLPILPSAPEDN